jgi:hypothetical protein
MQCPVQRASHRVQRVHPLHRIARIVWRDQPQDDVNPADDEDTLLGFNFTNDIRAQLSAARLDLARFQRAAKRAEQSTAGRGDDVVKRRGVRFGERRGIDLVVFGDRAMHAEGDRLRFARQTRDPQRSLHALDVNPGRVDHL